MARGSLPSGVTLTAFAVSTVIFGSNFVAVRFSNAELAPFWGAGLRFTLASLLLFGIVAARGIALPRGRALAGAVLFGALMFGAFFGLMYWGLQDAPAGVASVLFALLPVVVLFLAMAHRLETFRWRGLVGALVAAAGVAVVFLDSLGQHVPPYAMLAILGGVIIAGEAVTVVKRFPPSHPLAVNAVGMATGAVLLLTLSLLVGETWAWPARVPTLLAVGWLVVFGSIVGFVLLVFVIGRWHASTTSYQAVLQPLVTVLLAAWLAGESTTRLFLLGAVLVVAGVYVGTLLPERRRSGRSFSPAP